MLLGGLVLFLSKDIGNKLFLSKIFSKARRKIMNLESFIDIPKWGNPSEIERRKRIRLAVAAYAYEFDSDSIMSDGDFDKLCLEINPHMSTVENHHNEDTIKRYKVLDAFWNEEFQPDTGQWIHKHPELELVKSTYFKHFARKKRKK